MPLQDLDAMPQSRPLRRRSRIWIVATLFIGTATAVIANPQPAPQGPAPIVAQGPTHSPPPSGEVTSSIGMMTAPANTVRQGLANSTIPTPERKILILLLGLCFLVMVFGGYGLWRRGVEDMVRAKAPPPPTKRDRRA
jgi:hypothetical protein